MSTAEREAVRVLRDPATIRTRCESLLAAGLDDRLAHWSVRPDRLPATASLVLEVMRENYPDLRIPNHSRWRHFDAGGVDRVALLEPQLAQLERDERARCLIDLVVVSVLLDAGAGSDWRFVEPETQQVHARSEGLAVASLHMFREGLFSSVPHRPLRVDAARLANLPEQTLADALQVGEENPLLGLSGRSELLRRLGQALRQAPRYFERDGQHRPGHLFDWLRAHAADGPLAARDVLDAVLEGLGPIWPGRLQLGETNLGDVWPHPLAGGDGPARGLVPFHKLSQWLTYSLLEALQAGGLAVRAVEALTGLAEYRNGGLFIDQGVLVPKRASSLEALHTPGSELVVEWRALTLALLDRVAAELRARLDLSEAQLPLAQVLQGGTWASGRKLAYAKRDGRPPLRIQSDGTVF